MVVWFGAFFSIISLFFFLEKDETKATMSDLQEPKLWLFPLPNTYTLCPALELQLRCLSQKMHTTREREREKASFVFFYYIKIQKFERKFSYGTKRLKWYGDMNMTLLSYSQRLSTGQRLWPRSPTVFICFCLFVFPSKGCRWWLHSGWDAFFFFCFFLLFFFLLLSVAFCPGFSLLVEEMRDPRSKKWSRMVTGSPDSSGKWEKSNTNIIHKALVQHHTVWVNCSQKVKWSLIPDAMT